MPLSAVLPIFAPAGTSIIGAFLDLPAVFVDKYYCFFGDEFGLGTERFISNTALLTILYYFELIFIFLIRILPFGLGISAILMGIGLDGKNIFLACQAVMYTRSHMHNYSDA